MALNTDTNSKIMDVIKDLVCMRDISVRPQNFSIYLAKTTTEDNKVINRSIESANASRPPQILSERSAPNATPLARDNVSRTRQSRQISNRPPEEFSRQLNVGRNATTHSSQLPLTLKNSNDPFRPKIFPIRKTDPKQIAAKVESQCSNSRLTRYEREALISRILTNELEIQSKLTAQTEELFSSPKSGSFQRPAAPSKLNRKDNDQLMASLKKKRLQIEANRAAQERIIFSPTVAPPTLESTTPTAKNNSNDGKSQSRPSKSTNSRRQSHQKFGRPLTPIAEISEAQRDSDSATEIDGARNVEGNNRYDMGTILGKENFRQKQMESRLPSELIEDFETSLLLQRSEESDSLEELIIKDFPIRIIESEPDPITSSLPITEQVILESNKLKEMMESVKDRFQIKIARDKFSERQQQKKMPPNPLPVVSIMEYNKEKSQTFSPISDNDEPASIAAINILDSHNWGNAALPKSIFDDSTESGNNSVDEAVLSEREMQYDDLFGVDNVLEPVVLRSVPQSSKKIDQTQRLTEPLLHSIENIEDLENPQFTDLPSDVSDRSITENFNFYGDLHDLDDPPQKQSKINIEKPNQQLRDGTDSFDETEHEKDIRKLKDLIDSGAFTSSIMNQRFEEGVLDLLLRQSDSLWDPVVVGIPITHFIPSRNHELGLLDSSINETNLEDPLIKQPKKKLPKFMESLEDEWSSKVKTNGADSTDVNENSNDENVLLHGLPKFSYKPAPQYLYRKKINIMDSIDEADDDDDDILGDQEMNFDDLIDNVAEPTYDFQKAKVMDDLEIKMKIIRRMTEKSDASFKDLRLSREVNSRLDKLPPNNPPKQITPNRSDPVENSVKIRKSVSFADRVQENDMSKLGTNVNGNSKVTPQENLPKSSEIGRWTTIGISEVKDLIEHARLAQAKHTGTRNISIN